MHKALPALVVALLGCTPGKGAEHEGSRVAKVTHANVPSTNVAGAVIADPAKPPPVLVIVNAANALSVNAAPTWDAIATTDVEIGAHPATHLQLETLLAEGLGQPPSAVVASFDRPPMPEDTATRAGSGMQDDPPPDEDDVPDDDIDVNTKVTLDEGKMARDAAMKKADPAAYERRKARGLYALGGARNGRAKKYTGYAGIERASDIVGEVARDGKLDPEQRGVVLAAPHAKATALIEAVTASEGLIAVATDRGVRPLRTQFLVDHEAGSRAPRHWIELHVGVSTLAFEAVPDVPVAAPSLDPVAFAGALAKARDRRKLDPLAPVDVLVDADIDAQRLVDALIALDQAGVTMIGLGTAPVPGSAAAKQRGVRRPWVTPMRPSANGDLDKAVIRTFVAAEATKLRACYEQELAKAPDLSGTVSVYFRIKPDGKVDTATVDGHLGVATCFAKVINAIAFPKVRGGGVVQVSYPFKLEP